MREFNPDFQRKTGGCESCHLGGPDFAAAAGRLLAVTDCNTGGTMGMTGNTSFSTTMTGQRRSPALPGAGSVDSWRAGQTILATTIRSFKGLEVDVVLLLLKE